MNKYIISLATIVTLGFLPMTVSAKMDPALPVSDPVMSVAPSLGDEQSSVSDVSVGNQDNSGSPSTDNGSNSTVPATGGQNSTVGTVSTVSAPVSTTYVAPSFGIGGGFAGGSVSCNTISSNMKLGANNDKSEVTKLQNFLNSKENAHLTVTGIFDIATENAVKAFQKKYADTILAPWGATEASGNVYITTIKKINQLSCNQPLTLNPSELAIINGYKSRVAESNTASVPTVKVGPTIENTNPEVSPSATPSTNVEVGSNGSTVNTNEATAVKATVLQRFWNFLKRLF